MKNQNNIRDPITRWFTINEYYDRDTGEEIPLQELKKYIIIKKTSSYEFNETKRTKTGIKKIINECWKSEQLKLEL